MPETCVIIFPKNTGPSHHRIILFTIFEASKHKTFKTSKSMKIGIPKEIKQGENRVGMTPAGVAELVRHGHNVYVQHTAGEGSAFPDEDYVKAGATIPAAGRPGSAIASGQDGRILDQHRRQRPVAQIVKR